MVHQDLYWGRSGTDEAFSNETFHNSIQIEILSTVNFYFTPKRNFITVHRTLTGSSPSFSNTVSFKLILF